MLSVTPSSLESFLGHPSRPSGTLRYHELQGFLFAVASAPDFVPPREWVGLIFGERDAGFASAEEAQAIIGEIMTLYNVFSASIFSGDVRLPADCQFRDDVLENLDERAPVSQWSRGWLLGHQWLEESWEPYIADELEEPFGATLLALSFFSSRGLAEAFVKEVRVGTLVETAEFVRDAMPDAAADYARLGRSIQTILMSATNEPRRSVKVGRNDPCPCGSGRKYKKCCGAEA